MREPCAECRAGNVAYDDRMTEAAWYWYRKGADEARASLALRVDQLEKDLAEADRRVGAAERERASTHDQMTQVGRARATMKDQWGVSQTASFDQVWAEALQLKKQVRHLLEDLVTESTDPDGLVNYTVQNSLTTTNLIAALKRLPM